MSNYIRSAGDFALKIKLLNAFLFQASFFSLHPPTERESIARKRFQSPKIYMRFDTSHVIIY